MGCDDFIVKPVDEELLLARIHAIIKRSGRANQARSKELHFQIGAFHFDRIGQALIKDGDKQFLTDREAQLLQLLCEHKNRLLDRKKALRDLWGNNDEFNRKSMDVFIFRLRKYLESDPQVRIRNVHGKGFVLEEFSALP